MSGTWIMITARLDHLWRRLGRLRWWAPQILVAVPGIVLVLAAPLPLDAEGYRFFVLRFPGHRYSAATDVARSAGLPFAVYHLGCERREDASLVNGLFPRRGPVVLIGA